MIMWYHVGEVMIYFDMLSLKINSGSYCGLCLATGVMAVTVEQTSSEGTGI